MRLSRKKILLIGLGILFIIIFLVLRSIFPKNTDTLPFFLVLMIADLYLWIAIRRFLVSFNRIIKFIIASLYWLPMILLIGFLITLPFTPITKLGITFRTYWLGWIFIGYSAKMIPILLLVVNDLFRGIKFLFLALFSSRKTKEASFKRNKPILITGFSLGFIHLLIFMMGMFFWAHAFRVIHQEIRLPELPTTFEGMKIVQISDVHLGSWTSKRQLDKAIDLVNAQQPDLIFVTGDMANYLTDDVIPFRENLSRLKAKEEIFVIMGNHDYGDYTTWPTEKDRLQSLEELYNFYRSLNWRLLLNENQVIKRGNDSIAIIGVHNWGRSRRFQRLGDLAKAEKNVENMAVQLLLSHDPTHWEFVVSKSYPNIDVTFAGHTHAFQLGFELFGKEYSPSAFFYRNWGGLYESPVAGSHPQYLYVNRGLGTIGYPGRIGETPEITLFTLRK